MNKKRGIIVIILFALSFIFIGIGLEFSKPDNNDSIKSQAIHYFTSNESLVTYLSEIDYVASQSYAGWDKIRYDEANGGNKISVRIENNVFTFDRGIWAHATSQITYDISKYNYKYFTAFIGLNTTSNGGNGVKFYIYTSVDGKDWKEAGSYTKNPRENATFIKIDIEGAKYLRLYANDNGANGQDHSVYADAKLVNEIDNVTTFKSVDEYNEIIKSQYNGQTNLTGELELNLLRKELIKNVGQYTINSFYNESVENKAVIDWLMNDQDVLRYYILGGAPEGTYYNSLVELARLYRNYKDDFSNEEITQYGTRLGDLYTRMAVSLSLTHSKLVGLWMQSNQIENQSDSVRRYAIYRFMHRNGNLNVIAGLDITKWFENYTIEEMRFVMNNNIDDEEILWLNAYTQQFIDAQGSVGSRLTPHPYMSYVWPNYGNELYYAEENREYFNDLFSVPNKSKPEEKIGLWDLSYTIPGGVDFPEYTIKITRGTSERKLYKVWMNIRNKFGTGAVCGGISKTGSNIRGVHGIPSAVIGQPGHAAIIYYTQDSQGNGYWNLDNDVSGWAYSEKGERMLLGWGNASYSRGYSVVYMALAQEVINDNFKFEQSEKYVYLAGSYQNDFKKQEAAYRKALEIQPLNINAWYGLITLYNNSNKAEEDYYELAKELAEELKYFPLPMYHLTNLIKPKLTSIENSYKFTLLQSRILTEASTIPNNTVDKYYVYQPSLTRLEAKHLLGVIDSTIATFSFDGDNAKKIVLSSKFDGSGVRWDYSLDGKKTWHEVAFTAEEAHEWKLTKEEINAITAENDIYIHIVGVNYDEENLYKIDIKESAGLPEELFGNDLENRLIGAVDSIEWKYNDNDDWKLYKDLKPDLTGDKTIILRMGATGTYLASTSSISYTFTKDVVDKKRKYIPISHLTVDAVSTEAVNQKGSASNAIDANYNTRWHSAWNGSDTERYITIKLDKPYNISAVEFVPAGGGNGKIYDGTVYGSVDGENWIVLSQKKNLTYTNAVNTLDQVFENIKSFDVEIPQRVQYVKIVADRTNGNWFTARAFNFYEDTTVKIVASFTFDGADAGVISLIDQEYKKEWKYSIDGGSTWNGAEGNKHQLSKSEINKITVKNGIKIKLDNDDTVYSIRIKDADTYEINPYVNDLENRLIGLADVSKLEWKYSTEDDWTSYSSCEPIVKGNRILQVRLKASGITLPGDVFEYHFTEDNQTENAKYIPVKHLSIYSYSSQSVDTKRPYYAVNVIDGNPNTQWHTDFRYSIANTEAYVAIKLDSPRYVSGLDYLHMDSSKETYGFMKQGKVYVSEDGENWKEAAIFSDVAQDDEIKHVQFTNSIYGQYVKLVIESYDNVFAAASMINLYEDVSQGVSNVEIKYDITDRTNQSVTAELVSDKDVTVINNAGSRVYTFTENGTFTFEYKDKTGDVKTINAVVDWIDKEVPTGIINYSIKDVTNEDVVATLVPSEDVIITNNNGSINYTFTENGEFTFEFVDLAGNKGAVTANVTWINKKAPTGTISYSRKSLTNEDVVATLNVGNDTVIINNQGLNKYTFTENGEFTFEFVDSTGNRGTTTAKVDWIDKVAPTAKVQYSTTLLTNKDVVVTLKDFNEEVEILNNNKKAVYTFTENGEFVFEIKDKAGNISKIKAVVNNIDKIAPKAKITYNPLTFTKQSVTATIGDFSEDVVILNNNGSNFYTFVRNGSFKFKIGDKAGNISFIEAKVDWIDEVTPIKPSLPEVINDGASIETGRSSMDSSKVILDTQNNDNKATTTESLYKMLKVDDITIKIPSSLVMDNQKLRIKYLEFTSTIKKKIGEGEFFELYLEPTQISKLTSKSIVMTVKIDSSKKLRGFYRILDDEGLEAIDYTLLSNDEIEAEVDELGKYLIAYNDFDNASKTTNETKINEKFYRFIFKNILIGFEIVLIASIFIVYFKRKNK